MAKDDIDENAKKYKDRFNREIPFPRIEIDNIIINPTDPDYFYVLKTQGIDESFNFKAFVLSEDLDNIQDKIYEMKKDAGYRDEETEEESKDGDSPAVTKKAVDWLERALKHMRENKMYNVNEDGMPRNDQKISLATRGTRSTEEPIGNLAEAINKAGQDDSSSDEDKNEPSDSDSDESEEKKDDNSAKGDQDEESKLKDDPPLESKKSKLSRQPTMKKAEEVKAVGAAPDGKGLNILKLNPQQSVAQDNLGAALAGIGANPQENMNASNRMQASKQNAGNNDDDEEEDQQEEKEEEKYTTETVNFVELVKDKYGVNNITNIGADLKRNPRVLMCCKFEAFGYSVKETISSEFDSSGRSFKFSDKIFFSSCGKYFVTMNKNRCLVYNAFNLVLESSDAYFELDDIEELESYDQVFVSEKAKYICVKHGGEYNIFNRQGTKISIIGVDSDNYAEYTRFISETHLVGTQYEQADQNTVIIKYDIKKEERQEIVKFDEYFYKVGVNHNGTACYLETDNQLYYSDLKSGSVPSKLLDGYEFLKCKSLNKDKTSILYTEESKTYFSLYEKSRMIFRKKLDLSTQGDELCITSNKNNQILYVEDSHTNKVIYTIDDKSLMDINFDYPVKLHYPFLIYPFDKNEIWVQRLDEQNVIRRFIFINVVSAFDFTDNVYRIENSNHRFERQIGVLLSYEFHHKISEFILESDGSGLVKRIQKPIKFTELPNSNILTFTMIEGKNDKNKLEPCMMLHYMNQLKFYYVKSGKIKKHYEVKYNQRNIIPFKNRIFFWEDKGREIQRLESPIAKDEKVFFYK